MKGRTYTDLLKHTRSIKEILEKNNDPTEQSQAQVLQLIAGIEVFEKHIQEVREEDETLIATRIYTLLCERSEEIEAKYITTPNEKVFPFGKTDNEKEIYIYITKHNFLFDTYTTQQKRAIAYSIERLDLKKVRSKNFRIKVGEMFNTGYYDKLDFLPEFGFFFEIIPSKNIKITTDLFAEINELLDDAIFELNSQLDTIVAEAQPRAHSI